MKPVYFNFNDFLTCLDLYCGGGCGAYGIKQAGFYVIGIDNQPRPNYLGDEFIQADCLHLPVNIHDFDFIWASPPCKKWSKSTILQGQKAVNSHPDLVTPTREIIKSHPFYCMENVPQAPMRADATFWGQQFGLENLWRKRIFELSFLVFEKPKPTYRPGTYVTITSSMGSNSHFYRRKAQGKRGTLNHIEYKNAMGIPICSKLDRYEVANGVAAPIAEYIANFAKQGIQATRR